MKVIDVEDVVILHRKLVERFGGSLGVRDLGLIEAALLRASATFDGKDLYPMIDDKVAAITHSLVKNHGFVDGNKRVGTAVMLLLLDINGIKIECTDTELIALGLGVADGSWDEARIKNWINNHTS
jgi:death-on-curing protein